MLSCLPSRTATRILTAGILVVGLASCALGPAMAATSTEIAVGGVVDFLTPYAVQAAGIVVSALLGWLAITVRRYIGIKVDEKHSRELKDALMEAVGFGLDTLNEYTDDVKFDVHSTVLASAMGYVGESVPDAINHFGITPERLARMIRARIGKLGLEFIEEPAEAEPAHG